MDKNIKLKDIMKMDVASEEFFDIYLAIKDKYWDLPKNPDDYQIHASLLNRLSHIDDEKLVVACGIVMNEIFQIAHKESGTRSGSFMIGELEMFFRLSDKPDGMDKMQKLLNNTVMVKGSKQ